MTDRDYYIVAFAIIGFIFILYHILHPVGRYLRRYFNNWFWRKTLRTNIWLSNNWDSLEKSSLQRRIMDFESRIDALERRGKNVDDWLGMQEKL